jgi:hypothetical protein
MEEPAMGQEVPRGAGEAGRHPVDQPGRRGQQRGAVMRGPTEGRGNQDRSDRRGRRQEQDPHLGGRVAPVVRGADNGQEQAQAGADGQGPAPVPQGEPGLGQVRSQGEGEEQPAHQEGLNQQQRPVAEGDELGDVGGHVGHHAGYPQAAMGQPGEQPEAQGHIGRLGRGGPLLPH